MIETLITAWAERVQEELRSLLEKAGRSDDEFERAYLEARIREKRERRAALKIIRKKWG